MPPPLVVVNLESPGNKLLDIAARDFHTRFAEVGRPTLSVDGTIPWDAGHGLNKKDSSPLPPGCDPSSCCYDRLDPRAVNQNQAVIP